MWEARRANADRLRTIAAALAAKMDSSHTRIDSLLFRIVAAHSALADADTATALQRLGALVPNATQGELEWQPWEALASEHLALARVSVAQRRYRDAIRVASEIDNSYPIAHLIHCVPPRDQAAAADALGDARSAGIYRLRLQTLAADTLPII